MKHRGQNDRKKINRAINELWDNYNEKKVCIFGILERVDG